MTRCPYCLGDLAAEGVVRCTACFTPHHRACFLEHTRCTQLGCGSTETTVDRGAEVGFGWDLHPFLATESADSAARFLSLQVTQDPAPEVKRPPRLRLDLPDQVRCGQLLEGRLRVFLPRALHGRGLRLSVRLDVAAEEGPSYAASTVLLGAPPSSWLERIKLEVRGEELLLPGGKTVFAFRFDPSTFPPRTRLPQHERLGVYHALELRIDLESRAFPWQSRARRVVVLHQPGRCGHRGPRAPWPDARLR